MSFDCPFFCVLWDFLTLFSIQELYLCLCSESTQLTRDSFLCATRGNSLFFSFAALNWISVPHLIASLVRKQTSGHHESDSVLHVS